MEANYINIACFWSVPSFLATLSTLLSWCFLPVLVAPPLALTWHRGQEVSPRDDAHGIEMRQNGGQGHCHHTGCCLPSGIRESVVTGYYGVALDCFLFVFIFSRCLNWIKQYEKLEVTKPLPSSPLFAGICVNDWQNERPRSNSCYDSDFNCLPVAFVGRCSGLK